MEIALNSLQNEQAKEDTTEPQAEHLTTAPTISDIRAQAAVLNGAGENFDKLFNNLRGSDFNVADTSPPTVSPAVGQVPSLNAIPAHDPRTILTVRSSQGKVHHITTFLSERTKRRIRSRRKGLVLGSGPDDSVVLKTEDEHPYSGLSLAEWSAANCRLMAHILATGELRPEHVAYYLAYTTQVMEYYEQYEWEAVLDFDHTYRERQAEYGFVWGSIPPNMELSLLARPRVRRQPLHDGTRKTTAHQPAKAPVCRMYVASNGECRFGDACKYTHPPLPEPSKNGAPAHH
jgi:hypothetical protein